MRSQGHALSGKFFLGLFFGISLMGCAGAIFPYKFYKPMLNDWHGTLLGAKPQDDLDAVKTCAPDDVTDGKCVVMKAGDFFQLKTEYLDMQNRLNECQSPN